MENNLFFLELSYQTALDRYLDDYYSLRIEEDSYKQKGDFEVKKEGLTEWVILTTEPLFSPGCDLIGYLEEYSFTRVQLIDESAVMVDLSCPINDFDDANYIKKCFDEALEFIPQWKEVEKAFKEMVEAQERWKIKRQQLEDRFYPKRRA